MYEPTYRDTKDIIFIRDEVDSAASSSSDGGPIFVRALEELDPRQLKNMENKKDGPIFEVINEKQQKNKVKDDIQIMRLDDETGIAETYQKIGDADVLKIESNPLTKDNSEKSPERKITLDVGTSPR